MFFLINDRTSIVVIWLSIHMAIFIVSVRKVYMSSIQSLNLNFLSFHYFAYCIYTCTRRKNQQYLLDERRKRPMKNVLKTIWKRCENLTRICYYVLRTFWVLNQNVLYGFQHLKKTSLYLMKNVLKTILKRFENPTEYWPGF